MNNQRDFVVFKDAEKYLEWYSNLSLEAASKIDNSYNFTKYYYDARNNQELVEKYKMASGVFNEMLHNFFKNEENWLKQKEKFTKRAKSLFDEASKYNKNFKVLIDDKDYFSYIYLSNKSKGIFVLEPNHYLDFIPQKDYSDVSFKELEEVLPDNSIKAVIPKSFNTKTLSVLNNEKELKDLALDKI